MPKQRMLIGAVLMVISLVFAGMLLSSPIQLWLLMTAIGVSTGLLFRTGQLYVVYGFGIGILLTFLREWQLYGTEVMKMTLLVYLFGILFSSIATTGVCFLRNRFSVGAAKS